MIRSFCCFSNIRRLRHSEAMSMRWCTYMNSLPPTLDAPRHIIAEPTSLLLTRALTIVSMELREAAMSLFSGCESHFPS